MTASVDNSREPGSNRETGSAQSVFEKRDTHRTISVVLAALVLIVFGRAMTCGFVNFDDDKYVIENPMVAHGLTFAGVKWAFTQAYAANWHPLTWISHMIDCELYDLEFAGHHFTNVALHAANAVLLFLLLWRLTGAMWRSAFVAGLFAVHPLRVESVAWIAERKDVLSGLFFMLTLLAYKSYTIHRALRTYLLTLVSFALGLMSKPMLVTLPFVMLLLDWWPLQRFPRSFNEGIPGRTLWQLIREKIPFFAMSGASSIATLIVQSRGGVAASLESVTAAQRIENAFVTYVRYLCKTCWPAKLAVPYPYPGSWPPVIVGLAVAFVVGVTIVAVLWARKVPFLAVGWLWYMGMLVPVIGLVQVGSQAMADRYTYLPLIGIFITVTWTAGELVQRWKRLQPAGAAVAVLMLGTCSVLTWEQIGYWRNSETLFLHAIESTGRNSLAEYNLASYYHVNNRLPEAIEHYGKAVEIRPTYDDALNNMGTALASTGQFDKGIEAISEAIRLRPEKADAQYNLGNVFAMQRRWEDAKRAYKEALRLNPDSPQVHNNLANVLAMQGRKEEAVFHYRETLRLNPNHAGARRQLELMGLQP